jgi:hypothetical protein
MEEPDRSVRRVCVRTVRLRIEKCCHSRGNLINFFRGLVSRPFDEFDVLGKFLFLSRKQLAGTNKSTHATVSTLDSDFRGELL